ncbi:formimidoylglutamase [Micrococcus terreus]|uniref:Formimidoylglutamase n=1 Tax=Micrococcus terreus TaxID=574650 RepID=A0A1I7MS84_9MICC|nr:formimidoylglutamase [Micrococcus terreus]SFV24778.1 formiminoglutamase [Micrococcus terreus]
MSIPPAGWSGRTDGTGPEHLRWHQAVRALDSTAFPTTAPSPEQAGSASAGGDSDAGGDAHTTALVGFASDEGVRRNHGRVGAAQGPAALRSALSSLAVVDGTGSLADAGDVSVQLGDEDSPGDLEVGQAQLAQRITALLDAHDLTVVLGGGHETTYASYSGLAGSARVGSDTRIGILNLDAHFDLRQAPLPSSGTPFLQAAQDEQSAGRQFSYAVVGISEANNTRILFQTAEQLSVRWLTDEQSQTADLDAVRQFVRGFIAEVDVLYLTIDLDVLPAAVAPGVSAPAGLGVPLEVITACVQEATRSGKLALADVVELNPTLDVDGRTARTAARLIHTIVTRHQS